MQKRLSRLYVEVLHYFAGIFPLFTQVSGTGPWKFIILRVEMLQQVYRGFFFYRFTGVLNQAQGITLAV